MQKLEQTFQGIEDEYDRRFAELIEWRLRERLAMTASAQWTSYAVGTNQFHVDYGQNACTAAATAAALYVLNYIAEQDGVASQDVMPNLPWDTIVETGTRLWLEYATSSAGLANPSGHVEFDQLLACGGTFCSTVKRAFEVIVEIAGHTDEAVVAAMDEEALPKTLRWMVKDIPPRSAAIVTATSVDVHRDGHGIGAESAAMARAPLPPDNNNSSERGGVGVTLVVMRLADTDYWVYDSHGSVDTESRALLCHCRTAGAAAAVLTQQLPTGLYCTTVVKRRRARQ